MAKQAPVLLRIAVDIASGPVDDPFVSEVGGQGIVVCGEGAGAADDCESKHMRIVGRASSCGAKGLFFVLESVSADLRCPARSNSTRCRPTS